MKIFIQRDHADYKEDMMYAKAMGMTIKLLACSRRDEDHIHAIVAPYLLSSSHPLYSVNDVFNAIFVHGNVLGDAMFYGAVQEASDSECGCF